MSASDKVWLNGNPPQCEDVDLNGFKNENNNLILSAGMSLNTSDNLQTTKAVSRYSTLGDFYVESFSSVPDVYVLEPTLAQQGIFDLQIGMRIRFLVTNTNTGASTVNVNGTGVVNIKLSDGITDPPAGTFIAGQIAQLVYNGVVFLSTAIVASQSTFEIKTLSADITSNGTMTDLSFTLTPGRLYQFDGFFRILESSNGTISSVIVYDSATVIAEPWIRHSLGDQMGAALSFSMKYRMTSTDLHFDMANYNSGDTIYGDGTTRETYVQVTDIEDLYIEGTIT